jgi:hypothetical protein
VRENGEEQEKTSNSAYIIVKVPHTNVINIFSMIHFERANASKVNTFS